jgi:dipeptidyl aminopeptidase/acylaminoacyl peptidase
MPRRAIALLALAALSPLAVPLVSESSADDLTTTVTAMARIGRSFSPSFSPDGKRIAFISDLSGVPQVWVVPTEGGYPQAVTAFDDPVIAQTWSPNGDWLAVSIAPGGGMNSQVYVVRSSGTGVRRLTEGGKENNWLGDWTRDGKYLSLSSSRRDPAAMDAYLTDPVGGQLTLVAENPGTGQITSVATDNRSAVVGRMRSRGDNDLYLVNVATHTETRLTPHTPPALFDGGTLAPDGRTIYLTSNDGRDLMAFGRIRLDASGKPGPIEILADRAGAELDGYVLNDQGTLAVLAWNVAGRAELELYDTRTGRRSPGPKPPSDLVGGLTFSHDGNRLAMVSSGAAAPADIWVYDVRTQKLWQVTHSSHAGVDLAALTRPRLVEFKSFDGLALSGWLYEPKNFAKPGPVVLSFHGGPEGQERPTFRGDYQALTSQGIAVFAPNVRGSSGFGKKFVNLDNGALRVNGVKDIKACVDYLVANGIADPKRVGITGGSYGGYMTMAGLTEFPDMFAAGADLFGIVNFETFFKHTEPWMAAISTVEYGDPATQADMLRSLSPIYKLDRIKAATMVLHGANDTNVPVVEAEQIVDKLKQRGVEVEYVKFPDEGHGWRKVSNRIKSTVEVTKFFVKNLGAERTAAN